MRFRIPTMKLKIPGKAFLKTLFYIFHNFFMVAYLLSPSRCHWQTQVKNYNLNVTEVRDSGFGFQKCLSRNFQLHRRDPTVHFESWIPEPVQMLRIAFNYYVILVNSDLTSRMSRSVPLRPFETVSGLKKRLEYFC